jgi:WXXGXW repeat (2 copies)
VRITRSLSAIIATILIAAVPLAASAQFSVGIGFTVGAPPPPLPVYAMPVAPAPNYQWTPGYWAWGPAGYYWVPGTWVPAPSVGLYWTPGYWGYGGGGYAWNAGYWGPSVGFYGGVNYGFGYFGAGFVGGYWAGGAFNYNAAVVNVNRSVVNNVYVNKTVINKNVTCGNNCHVSYNGGHGGITAKPTSAQLAARQHGIAPTTAQRQQATFAAQDRNLYANVNHGKPPVTASQKPFTDPKQIPHSAPVTAADKQTAQKEVMSTGSQGTSKTPTTANKAPATQPKPANQPKQPHNNNAPMNKPHHNQPPPGGQAHHPQSSMNGHPTSGGHPQGGKPPSGSGEKPPATGGKPPSGNPNDKSKPPRH